MTGSVLQSLQAARGIESNEQYRSEVIVVSLGQVRNASGEHIC